MTTILRRLGAVVTALRCQRSGSVAVLFAFALVPVLLAAGMGLDYARIVNVKSHLQAEADGGALGGAALKTGGPDVRKKTAEKLLYQNANKHGISVSGVATVSGNTVTVTAVTNVSHTLMQLAGLYNTTVTVKSVAVFGTSGPCIIALDGDDSEALMLNSDSRIDSPDCSVHVNSNAKDALRANSNGDITAKQICVNGSAVNDSTSQLTPAPVKCPQVSDPLASLPVPDEADDPCNWTDRTVQSNVTLLPGVYCKKLELSAGVKVTFSPGIYVIRNGEFIVNSGAVATGSNIMIYLTGTSNNPRFNINSNSHIEFRGRTSGTFAGIVIYQARNAVSDYSILNSDSTSIIEGVIYLPNSPLHLNSFGHVSDSSPWTGIIVKKLQLNSDSVLHINTNYAGSSVPVPPGIGNASGAQSVRLIE